MSDTWSQGDFFPYSALPEELQDRLIKSMPMPKSIKPTAIVVIVTQDCDIAASDQLEPWLQFVVGEPVKERDIYEGNVAVRSARNLVLDGTYLGARYQLKIMKTCFLPRAIFFSQSEIQNNRNPLEEDDRYQLKRWLIRRFNRSALPDNFNVRIKPIRELLQNFKVDLYIRLHSKKEGLDKYKVSLIAVPYKGAGLSGQDVYEIRSAVESLANEINKTDGLLFDREWLDDIECTLFMERHEVSLAHLDNFELWTLDYISISDNDHASSEE